MKNIKKIFTIMIIIVVACGVGYSSAEGYGQGETCSPDFKGKKMHKVMEELGLTQEQKDQLKEMKIGNREAAKQLREKIKTKRGEMKAELTKPQSDRNKLDSIIEEIGELKKETMRSRIDSVLRMKMVLTPEQYKLLNEKTQKKHKEWKKNKKKRGPNDQA